MSVPVGGRDLAIISCVHGNLEALDAVLGDIGRRGVTQILCLGDLVGYGPYPNEVVHRLRELQVPTVLGCWDEGIAQDNETCGCSFVSEEEGFLGAMAFWWTATKISDEAKSHLGTLPRSLAYDLPCGRLVAVHGSPASSSEYLTESTHELVLLERVARAGCDILACGHTHIPYVKRMAGTLEVRAHASLEDRVYRVDAQPPVRPVLLSPKTVINAGSVGEPRHGGTAATYTILDTRSGDVEICEVAYDLEKTLHAMRAREVPIEFIERLQNGQELTGKSKEIFCAC